MNGEMGADPGFGDARAGSGSALGDGVRTGRRAAHFADLAVRLHDEPSVAETLEEVLDYALHGVGCSSAAVAFTHGRGRVETAATTDPRLTELLKVQVELGEGPALEVMRTGGSALVTEIRGDSRWPCWAARAADLGLSSLLTVRLGTGDVTVGSLDLYSEDPRRFDEGDVEIAQIFARHAAVALASARNLENLWNAVDARKVVGQAQGILMERFGLAPDRAMSVLLRYSQDGNLRLRAVAEELIRTTQLPRGHPGRRGSLSGRGPADPPEGLTLGAAGGPA